KAQAPPRPAALRSELNVSQLEVRSVPNDPFGMAQAAGVVPVLALMAPSFQTPSQVLLQGGAALGTPLDWRLEHAVSARNAQSDTETQSVRPEGRDAFFVGLNLNLRPTQERERPSEVSERSKGQFDLLSEPRDEYP